MYAGSHSKGIFYCNRGPGKGWRNAKWNKLQGGDWDIPPSAKTEYLCSWKKKNKKQKRKRLLVFLIYRSNKLMVKTLHGQMTKDGTTVYISAKTARADSADLSSRLLCSIRTAKTRSLAVLALVLNLRTSADQLLLDLGALFPFILETSQKCFVFVFFLLCNSTTLKETVH